MKKTSRIPKNYFAFSLLLLLIGFDRPSAETYDWNSVVMGGGGFVTAIVASPAERNLFYARTDVGGAYRWQESSQSWIPLLDWNSLDDRGYQGVESIALDPQNASRLYLLVGTSYFSGGKTAILRSTDYGKTFTASVVTTLFTAHGNGTLRGNGEKLVVDPNQSDILFCGSRTKGLFKSTDAGATWTAVTSFPLSAGPEIKFVVMDKSSSTLGNATKTLYAGVARSDSSLYASKDGGKTWSQVKGGPVLGELQRAAITPEGLLYITYGSDSNSAVWCYNTKTDTWINKTPASVARAYSAINIDPSNPQRILATQISWTWTPIGYGDRIHISADGGTTWKETVGNSNAVFETYGAGGAIHWSGTAAIDPFNPKRVFVNSGNGIFMTPNIDSAKVVWKFMVKGLEEMVPLDLVSLPYLQLLSGVGDVDGFSHVDVKATPIKNKPGMNNNCTGVAGATKRTGFLARVGSRLAYSTNNGTTWSDYATVPISTANRGSIALSSDGNTLLWTLDTITYRTSDLGASWTTVQGLHKGGHIVADFENPRKFYFYDRATGDFYASFNSGVSFAKVGSTSKYGSGRVAVVPNRDGEIWIAMGGGGIVVSRDSGTTFTKVPGTLSADAIGIGKAAPGQSHPALYIWGKVGTGVSGMYRSIDSGSTWTRINDDLHQYGGANGIVVGDPSIYGRVYMSTVGRGVVYGEIRSNLAPTDIALSNASIPENVAVNAVVGTFTTIDPDTGNAFVYSLVTGTGSTDNSSFNIVGTTLQTSQNLLAQTKNSFNIRIRSTDQDGLYFEKTFTIDMTTTPTTIKGIDHQPMDDRGNSTPHYDLLGRKIVEIR